MDEACVTPLCLPHDSSGTALAITSSSSSSQLGVRKLPPSMRAGIDCQPFLKKQKKQTSACDGCRKAKARCDGATPCMRCTKREAICTYSPQKRRGVRKKAAASSSALVAHPSGECDALVVDTTCSMLLDLFFTYTNNTLPRPLTRGTLERRSSKANLMQYYVALAFAARSTRQKRLSLSFERKARALAGDLFDHFTFDTAAAFAMLTSYYWGQEPRKCQYYGTMTKGICTDLSVTTDGASTSPSVVLLEVMASCNSVKWDTYLKNLVDRMKISLETSQDRTYVNQIRIALLLAEVKFALIRANPLTDETDFLSNMIAPKTLRDNLSADLVGFLLRKIAGAKELLTQEPLASKYANTWPLIQAILLSFESMLFFAKSDDQLALDKVKELLDVCDANKPLMAYAPPAIVQCIHFAFSVCYMYRDVGLAMRATGLMRILSSVLPMAETPLWNDTNHLKTLLKGGSAASDSPLQPDLDAWLVFPCSPSSPGIPILPEDLAGASSFMETTGGATVQEVDASSVAGPSSAGHVTSPPSPRAWWLAADMPESFLELLP